MIRTRHDVASLTLGDATKAQSQDWHPVLDTYARGIELMQARDEYDPRSWLWAANTHGTNDNPLRKEWAQCAHGSLYFLPWHRAYLTWFEAAIRTLTGEDEWRLPYWDYSVPGDEIDRALPVEFTVETRTVDGQIVPNPLFAPGRSGRALEAQDVDIVAALSESHYIKSYPQTGFGGVDPDGYRGLVEGTPHNDVHSDISGLMGRTTTAGQDPIFWLHHANIDRLWEVWRNLPGSIALTDPGAASPGLVKQWRSAKFVFGEVRSPSIYTMEEVEDLDALGYAYESTELPDNLAAAIQEAREATLAARGGMALERENERDWAPIAATFNLTSGEERDVPFTGGARGLVTAGARGLHETAPAVGLIIELAGVRATDPHAFYVLEVRSAPDAEVHRAGRFSTFGLAGTPETEERNYLIDASSVLPSLQDEGWSGGELSVRVVPEQGRADSDDADKAISVRQVTIYAPTP